jgi:hypothetical protein
MAGYSQTLLRGGGGGTLKKHKDVSTTVLVPSSEYFYLHPMSCWTISGNILLKCYSCQILMTVEISQHCFDKYSDTNFN